jgi:hypothetical protein
MQGVDGMFVLQAALDLTPADLPMQARAMPYSLGCMLMPERLNLVCVH